MYIKMTVRVPGKFKVICYFLYIGHLLEKVNVKYFMLLALHWYFSSSINDIHKE